MNIKDLQYIVALANTRHFAQAAAQCFVSQPTLSAQIKKLEGELGVTLFERNNKRVLTTKMGENLIRQARQILWECEQFKTIARNAHHPLTGRFHLGIIPTVSTYLLPHVLPVLKQKLPHIELTIRENQTDQVLIDLKNGDLDAAILALPIGLSGLQSVQLYSEPFYVALPTDHPLTTCKKIQLSALEKENLLLLAEGHCLREQALEACHLADNRSAYKQLDHDVTATSLETIKHLVACKMGITLLPALASLSLCSSQLMIKPFASPMPARRVGMVWRTSSVRETVCQKISDMIRSCYKALKLPYRSTALKLMHRSLHD